MRYCSIFNAVIITVLLLLSCKEKDHSTNVFEYADLIDYSGTPENTYDRVPFSFSDQGAWFSYGFTDSTSQSIGFTGPFLMTQENGIWISKCLSEIKLTDETGNDCIDWNNTFIKKTSYLSHLEQYIKNKNLEINQILLFESSEKAIIKTTIKNISKAKIEVAAQIFGNIFNKNVQLSQKENEIQITSSISNTYGKIFTNQGIEHLECNDTSYNFTLNTLKIEPNESKSFYITNVFVSNRKLYKHEIINNEVFEKLLNKRISEKETQIEKVISDIPQKWKSQAYINTVVKSILTLQNNWRVAKEGIPYDGCFPSYHYEWFHGFWAWDSWKHSVALVKINPELAKNQIRAMYYFQEPNGFIPDCVYRDTSIEANNYRNTKAPLSAWSVWKVFEETKDTSFIKEMFESVVKYHTWWYKERDHDKDGICEYGSTDGTLIAAKWESGMDNAIRFDESKILKNSDNAYSLNQESVDLNSYLYAEKIFISKMARIIGLNTDYEKYLTESQILKEKIKTQFWDNKSGWFYDTDITGKAFIEIMGPEGWIPLWANIANKEQAEMVRNNMMDSTKFLTYVPFPTVSADHPKFKPDGGYWRGPVWLDQAYFAVVALKNYQFNTEADLATQMLIENAEGLSNKGPAIRENYHPLNGKGLESYNFSWSAAHYLLLLTEE